VGTDVIGSSGLTIVGSLVGSGAGSMVGSDAIDSSGLTIVGSLVGSGAGVSSVSVFTIVGTDAVSDSAGGVEFVGVSIVVGSFALDSVLATGSG